jgi:hypothetical protein
MNFARKAKRVARRQHRRGLITREEYDKVKKAVLDPEIVKKWQAEVEKQLGAPWKARTGKIDWSAIWDWFVRNWPTIQAILFKLLPLIILSPSMATRKPEYKPEGENNDEN